jgi:DNA-binding NtrC family response regulator
VRVLAATNRDLAGMVETGQFRQDLYYRLAVVTLRVPSLRERRADIPLVVAAFLDRFARENGRQAPKLAAEALQVIRQAPWPGNVRELRNVVESLVILNPGAEILLQHLPEDLRRAARDGAAALASSELAAPSLVGRTMEEVERALILTTLEQTAGNRTQAAEILGIGLRTLQRKIKQYRAEGHAVMGADIGD